MGNNIHVQVSYVLQKVSKFFSQKVSLEPSGGGGWGLRIQAERILYHYIYIYIYIYALFDSYIKVVKGKVNTFIKPWHLCSSTMFCQISWAISIASLASTAMIRNHWKPDPPGGKYVWLCNQYFVCWRHLQRQWWQGLSFVYTRKRHVKPWIFICILVWIKHWFQLLLPYWYVG